MADKLSVIQAAETEIELQKIIDKAKVLVAEFNELKKSVDSVNGMMKSGLPKEYVEAYKKLPTELEKVISLTKQLEKAERELEKLRAGNNKPTNNPRVKEITAESEALKVLSKDKRQQRIVDAQEQQLLRGQISLYNSVQLKLTALTTKYNELAVRKQLGLKLNAQEEKSLTNLEAKIKKYDTALKAVDASAGKHQRNVGNYASGFNALGNSFNQLTREAPAFAVSMSTGFLALSNNLPIFFDAISDIQKKNKILQAEGKKTQSVLSQMGTAIFSWGTALSIGVTLLTLYGADLVDFAKELMGTKKALTEATAAQESFSEALANGDYAKAVSDVREMAELVDLAKKGFIDKERVLKQYNEGLGQVMGTAKSFNEIEDIMVAKTPAYLAAMRYRSAANVALQKSSEERAKAEFAAFQQESDFYGVGEKVAKFALDVLPTTELMRKRSMAGLKKRAEEERKLVRDEANKTANTFDKVYDSFKDKEAKAASGLNMSNYFLGADSSKGGTSKSDSDAKAKQEREERYKLELAQLEAKFSKQQLLTDKWLNEINENETTFETQKIEARNDYYLKVIEEEEAYWKSRIELEKKYGKETFTLEAERDKSIAALQDKQRLSMAKYNDALKEKLKFLQDIEQAYRDAGNADAKREILANKMLSNDERQLLLDKLSYESTKKNIEVELRNLDLERAKLLLSDMSILANQTRLAQLDELIAKNKLANQENETDDDEKKLERLAKQLEGFKNLVSGGLSDMGFERLSQDFDRLFKDIISGALKVEDAIVMAASLMGDSLGMMVENNKAKTIAALDEQLRYSQATTEQEIAFIQSRIDAINNIQDKTAEQIEERNALEDEARTLKEQQAQREKQIATQKARAEQQAAAQQALINGGVSATKTLAEMGFVAGIPYAIASLAFGALQAGLIMARNPVPQYFVGRNGGGAEWALTQDRYGAEAITDKDGNIKTWGTNTGSRMTWLEAGDNVHTARETKLMKEKLTPNFESMMFNNVATPINMINRVDEEKIIKGINEGYERVAKLYDKPVTYEKNGILYYKEGKSLPIILGEAEEKRIIIKEKKNYRD